MIFRIITTQPNIYDSFLKNGLIARGLLKKIINIKLYDLHDFAFDKHRTIDDTPAGGGAGMVLKVDVMANAINKIRDPNDKCRIILLTPQGKKFEQSDAKRLAKEKNIILIAGRFEGYDERIRDLVDEEISIGDFVLTSGDLPVQTIIDATSRMIPGFIEKSESINEESFEIRHSDFGFLLEYPQYTRPIDFEGKKVPDVLLSGDHGKIKNWRNEKSVERTSERRPDII